MIFAKPLFGIAMTVTSMFYLIFTVEGVFEESYHIKTLQGLLGNLSSHQRQRFLGSARKSSATGA